MKRTVLVTGGTRGIGREVVRQLAPSWRVLVGGMDAARVDAVVAAQMASGVCRLLGTDVGLATTGVAGPGPSAGVPAGTVHVAVCGPWDSRPTSRVLSLDGDRESVRTATVAAVLDLLTRLTRGRARPTAVPTL